MVGNGNQLGDSIIEPVLYGVDPYPGNNYPYLPYQSLDSDMWMEVNAPDGYFYFNITYYANFTVIGKFAD